MHERHPAEYVNADEYVNVTALNIYGGRYVLDASRAVILLSGGLDSTCLAAILKRRTGLHALTVDYGQRHSAELVAARNVAQVLDLSHTVATLPALAALLPGSSLTSGTTGGLSPVVPGRNAILIAIAGGFAAAHGFESVTLAAHRDDHDGFADCRAGFVTCMADVLVTYGVALSAPYMNATKLDLLRDGLAAGAPVDLSWSCYGAGAVPCGQCAACGERQRALRELRS